MTVVLGKVLQPEELSYETLMMTLSSLLHSDEYKQNVKTLSNLVKHSRTTSLEVGQNQVNKLIKADNFVTLGSSLVD